MTGIIGILRKYQENPEELLLAFDKVGLIHKVISKVIISQFLSGDEECLVVEDGTDSLDDEKEVDWSLAKNRNARTGMRTPSRFVDWAYSNASNNDSDDDDKFVILPANDTDDGSDWDQHEDDDEEYEDISVTNSKASQDNHTNGSHVIQSRNITQQNSTKTSNIISNTGSQNPKRKRGRPKSIPVSAPVSAPVSEESDEPKAKKRRGRKPKNEIEQVYIGIRNRGFDPSDYHTMMNSNAFIHYMSKVLQLLPRNAVFVYDQATIHTSIPEEDKRPNTNTTKKGSQEWLKKHDAPENDYKNLNKKELYAYYKDFLNEKLAENDERFHCQTKLEKYVQEWNAANNNDIKLLMLPVAHCDLNPIESVWSYLKRHTSKYNKKYNIQDCISNFKEAVIKVNENDGENLKGYLRYSKRYEQQCKEDLATMRRENNNSSSHASVEEGIAALSSVD